MDRIVESVVVGALSLDDTFALKELMERPWPSNCAPRKTNDPGGKNFFARVFAPLDDGVEILVMGTQPSDFPFTFTKI